MSRTAICILLLPFLLSSLSSTVLSQAQAPRPNIVLIMADDFGYECLTCNGSESYQTPNLDKLAASGMRFEQCHVQPLCTPTRVQLMTGRSNIRNYVHFGTLLRQEKTFAHVLKTAGYATAICGKWQLGHEIDSPKHFGFDESCLWQHTRRPPRYANAGLEFNGIERDFKHGEYGPDLVNEFAIEFVTKNRQGPFMLYYPMILTHNPFQPTPDSREWDPKVNDEKQATHPKHFADMTAYMDKLIGRLLAKLDELGIRDNTLVLFLGDNGTNKTLKSKFQGNEYPGGKGTTTVRGTHVPFIASWPSKLKPGQVNRDLICSTDFFPTLCDAIGVEAPKNLDGNSFLPQLVGTQAKSRDWIYSWYSPRQQNDLTIREFAFDQQFKLYRDGKLFDIRSDPDEKRPLESANRSNAALAASAKLSKALEQFANARPKGKEYVQGLRTKD
ncbi:MAG: sulfatase-like hydrolase/transferase [Pirellula sp.]